MIVSPEYFFHDDSEFLDPRRTADELIAYAYWLREHALRETGRKVPLSAAMLIDAYEDRRRGPEVVYATFARHPQTKQWLDRTKRKMLRELQVNEDEALYDNG